MLVVRHRLEIVVVAVDGGQSQLQRHRPVIVRVAVVAVVMAEGEVEAHGERTRPGRHPERQDHDGDQPMAESSSH